MLASIVIGHYTARNGNDARFELVEILDGVINFGDGGNRCIFGYDGCVRSIFNSDISSQHFVGIGNRFLDGLGNGGDGSVIT
jgi:hypothetical protein